MTAARLTAQPTTVTQYDVVGRDSEHQATFVRHLGLALAAQATITEGAKLDVTDMRPPLTEAGDTWPISTVGTVPLTSDERNQIRVFLDERAGQYRYKSLNKDDRVATPSQYTIHPHVRRPTADCSYHRYSCVGLVIEAYREAGLDLLLTDDQDLPRVTLDLLRWAYADQGNYLDAPRMRARYGLAGDGPWPVVLPGYVLHAQARDEMEIRNGPYHPQAGDELFPR
jgi:hypothetical protein